MKTKFTKALGIGAAFTLLAAIIACGGDDEESSTTSSNTQPTTQQGVVVAQPGQTGNTPAVLQLGQPPASLAVPIPPSFNLTITEPGEYQLDVSSSGDGDPRMFVYQGDTLVEDDDDGGENTNARVVRFLTPGSYSIRVVEYRARAMTSTAQAQRLQPLAPTGTLTVGQPLVVQFPEFGLFDRPENDRGASRAVTLTVAAAGQYTCTATMDNDRRVQMQLIQGGATVVASDDQGFTENQASITQQLQPGAYEIRVWDTIYRGETRATITCNQG
jgi:hypothetical protein